MKNYETSDIYFAAYMNALGHQLSGTKKVEDSGKMKTVFVFELPDDEIESLKTGFFGGLGEVKALQYMYALRSLKSLCFI